MALSDSQRVVIKIGSALLVEADNGTLKKGWLEKLCQDIAALREQNKEIIIVSSGAIALGRARLNFCLLYTSPSPRDATLSRMPSSA